MDILSDLLQNVQTYIFNQHQCMKKHKIVSKKISKDYRNIMDQILMFIKNHVNTEQEENKSVVLPHIDKEIKVEHPDIESVIHIQESSPKHEHKDDAKIEYDSADTGNRNDLICIEIDGHDEKLHSESDHESDDGDDEDSFQNGDHWLVNLFSSGNFEEFENVYDESNTMDKITIVNTHDENYPDFPDKSRKYALETEDPDYEPEIKEEIHGIKNSKQVAVYRTKLKNSRSKANRARGFKCEHCPKYFRSQYHLRRHSITHTKDRHECYLCNEKFRHLYTYQKHMKEHDAVLKPPVLKEDKTEREKTFMCEVCTKMFGSKYHLNRHMKVHIKAADRIAGLFMCELCGAKFTLEANLKRHVALLHISPRPKKPPKRYTCEVCKKVYRSRDKLNKHVGVHQEKPKFTCEICSKQCIFKHNFEKHMRTHDLNHRMTNKTALCDVCTKVFKRPYQLKLHMLTHTKVKPHTCNVCKKSFTRKDGLKKHMGLMHADMKLFACKMCDEQYSGLKDLNIHIQESHSGVKPYSCDFCKLKFIRVSNLEKHIAKRHENYTYLEEVVQH